MKIGVYEDLPAGGAKVSIDAICAEISKSHHVAKLKPVNFQLSTNRIVRDLQLFFVLPFVFKKYAEEISSDFDFLLVTHDKYFTCPLLLRFSKLPTIYYCQEPTRAYFEEFLSVPKTWPLTNQLYEKFNRFWRKRQEISHTKLATAVVCNSQFSANRITKAYGITPTVVYLGVDTHIFKPSQKPKQQIMCVGNHEPQKNLTQAIEVVSLIDSKIRPPLLIVGPRESNCNELIKLAKKLKVDLIIKTGLTSSQMAQEYQKSYLTLAISILEPFGLSVIESLACETPVVAIAQGGFLETVVSEKDGYLCQTSASMAEKSAHLITHRDVVRKFGRFGRADVVERFSWSQVVKNIIKVADEITN